jgi:hypothetical protein
MLVIRPNNRTEEQKGMPLSFYEKIRDPNKWTEMYPVTKLTIVCM